MTSEYRQQEFQHTPVLLAECLEQSNLKPQQTFVDATLGGAGHSLEMAKLIGPGGTLIGIDQDEVALAAARSRLESLPDGRRPNLELLRGNFGDMDDLLVSAEVPGVDAFLFDLGVSSVQIDTPSRGFSFKENGPLDMRMDPGKTTLTAAEIVNTYNAADLTRIIRTYSDEKWASRIADFIGAVAGEWEDRDKRAARRRHQGRHTGLGAPRRGASGETDVSRRFGYESQLGAGRAASRSRRRRPLAQSGRAPSGHQLSFARGPHCEGNLQRVCEPLHLPAGPSGVRVREGADTRPGYAQAASAHGRGD